MASRIKGITVEIGAETKGLETALASVTKQSINIGKELTDVQKLLKLNPGNTALVAQKQQLLAKQVEITSQKLEGLKQAQSQVQAQFERGEIGEEQYRAFQRELEATEGALNGYKGQLENVQTEQDRLGQNTQRLETLFQATGTSVEDYQDILGSKLTNAIKNGTASADDMEVALNKIGKAALGGETDIGKMKDTLDKVDDGESIENVGQELQDLKPKADDASESLGKIEGAINAGNMMAAAEKIAEFGDKIKEAAEQALEAFGEVDEGLDTIVTKTGASGDQMAGFEEIYRRIGSDMPVELSKVGEAVGEVNTQLGLQGDELEKSSRQAIQFAEINGEDVSSSVIQAKQVLSAYSMENREFGTVLDTVTKVAQDTGQATGDLMKKAVDGAPQIKQLGLSFQDGVTLMGNFEKAGVDSSGALGSLSKAAVTYAKDGKTLQEGLNETKDKILNAKDETEALTVASEVFGTRGATRMVDAIKRGTLNLDDFAKASENSSGKVSKIFEDTLDPIDEMTVAQNNMTMAMAELGGTIAEVLAPVLQQLSQIIQQVAAWFNGLSPTTKQLIVVFGAIMVVFSALLPIVAAIGVAVTTLGTALLPIIAVVAGIIAAIIAAILIFQNWGTIVDWFTEKFGFLAPLFSNFGNVLDIFKNFFVNTFNNIKMIISGFVTIVQGILDIIVGIFTLNGEKIGQGFAKVFQGLVTAASGWLSQVLNTVTSILSGIANVFSSILGSIISIVANIFAKIVDAIMHPIDTVKGLIKGALEVIKGLFNFEFKWPKIPIPKFKISGSMNPLKWLSDGAPKISVDWFAKGGILTKPTVFGQNGNSLMAGGEAGKEAVAPIDTLMGYVRQAVAEAGGGTDPELIAAILALASRPVVLSVNDVAFAEATVEAMSSAQEKLVARAAGSNGYRRM